MKFTAIKNFPYVRDREARSIEEADTVRFGVPGGSSFVDARHPIRLASLLRSQGTEASHHATQLEVRNQSACRPGFSSTITSPIQDLDLVSAKSVHARLIHLEPPHHVSDPRSDPSLTRVAVKRRANSISQARWLDRAIHRAGQLIVSCL
jgi:hypothetical protein